MGELNIAFELDDDVLYLVFPEGVEPGQGIVFAQVIDAATQTLKSLGILEPENENDNG